MFDHVTIRVRDRAVSARFYDTVLVALGMDPTLTTDTFATWHDFGLTEAAAEHRVTRGLHVAFAAPSAEQAEDFWRSGVDAGYDDSGHASLRDPDGNVAEAVHREARPRLDGRIDEITLRVADLGASTAFYREVAAATGLEFDGQDPGRTLLADAGSGARLALVPGPPTEHVHLAFPGNDDAVRRFHAQTTAAGFRDNGEPGERPLHHPGYYAAYVLDPDGNNIEVVDHHRDPPPEPLTPIVGA